MKTGIVCAMVLIAPLAVHSEMYQAAAPMAQTGAPAGAVGTFDVATIKYALSHDRRVVFERAMEPVLTADQKEVFWTVFTDYEKEKEMVIGREIELLENYASQFRTMTSAQAAEMVNQFTTVQKKDIELRKKYARVMSKKINGVVAGRFFQVDELIGSALRVNTLARLPLLGGELQ